MNLYSLLQASASDPISPNILLNVTLADLHQLVVDTIEATRDRLLPVLIEQENQKGLLKREEAMKLLGVGSTTLHNLVKAGKLEKVKINGATRYRRSDILDLIESRNAD